MGLLDLVTSKIAMKNFPDIQINSSLANYSVQFSTLTDLSSWSPLGNAFLIDSFFSDKLSIPNDIPIIWIDSNECAKSFGSILEVFIELKKVGLGRDSHLVAIGGGVVQDIATFVASLYMRGISWSYVPTTFLGMADSCLGGKSSINVGSYKNLIGNFYPPQRIDILPLFARSLPKEELIAGIAEAAKICFCRGSLTFEKYEKLVQPIIDQEWDEYQLGKLLYMTLEVKKWFIEKDEFDKAERRLLNFGHTWGHALESATKFSVPHGLAVAIGMMAAIRFKDNQSYLTPLWNHCLSLLSPILSLDQINSFEDSLFLAAFLSDKKHSVGCFHLIVPVSRNSITPLGVEEIRIPADKESQDLILSAIRNTLNHLKETIQKPDSMNK